MVVVQVKVKALETSVAVSDVRIQAVETHQVQQGSRWLDLMPQVEDVEDRGRCNKLRLRGVPEAEGVEDVAVVSQSIFKLLSGADEEVTLDHAHRTLGPKSADLGPVISSAGCIIIQRKKISARERGMLEQFIFRVQRSKYSQIYPELPFREGRC